MKACKSWAATLFMERHLAARLKINLQFDPILAEVKEHEQS
jgi:hypothetical protein